MKPQDEIIGMRQLTDFQMDHSAFGGFVLLHPLSVTTTRINNIDTYWTSL